MALVNCKECGTKISDKALACPKCGATQIPTETILEDDILESDSLNTNGESNAWVKWLIVGVVVGLLILLGVVYYPKLFPQNNGNEMLLAEWDQELNDNNFNNNRMNGYEYVDLGLSVKWATCNVGATQPYEYGNYYAWGETTTKTSYNESNSVTYWQQISDFSGNATYDVARVNWGGSWRLPTKREMEELQNKCTWSWTTQSGVNGYRVTGPNGNSIFLPAAGFCGGSSRYIVGEGGCYWSSTPNESYTYYAYDLKFGSGGHDVSWSYRYFGLTVRPVSD